MADAILNLVFENLSSLIQEEVGLLLGAEKEMKRLSSTLSTIRAVLRDAEQKQFKDEAVRNWLKKLEDTAYDADDVLDGCATEALQLKVRCTGPDANNQVSKFLLPCFLCKRCKFSIKKARRLKEINEMLDSIATERSKFHLREGPLDIWLSGEERIPSDSLVIESEVYGRSEDKEQIVQLLLSADSSVEDVSIIPVVGFGGLGKTTLAQLAYNDSRVESQFELRMWVCVSEDFGIIRLLKAIVESAGGNAHKLTELDTVQRCFQEIIGGRRFLLVLDDVWNENKQKWDRLKHILTVKAKGSKIIVTTRSEKAALIMAPQSDHLHLKCLTEDDCWSLFKRHAFEIGGSEQHLNLVTIGKEIVKKCGGLPLAAKSLGSMLCFKKEGSEWLSIRDSEIWELPDNENSILPALRLSYNSLPSHIRACFAFCSVYPKEYPLVKEELIHIWIANGFVPPNGRKELEDIGNEIFNELLSRSFFQDIEKDKDGNILRCKMHHLIHDLAHSVVGNTCSIQRMNREKDIPKLTRHLYLGLPLSSPNIPEVLFGAHVLRTLIVGPLGLSLTMIPQCIFKLRYLRVLDLNSRKNNCLEELPNSIGHLKHLRYLNLSYSRIQSLPESTTKLQNLHALKVRRCSQLLNLPKDMRNMRCLRHLDNYGCSSLAHMPIGIGQLRYLQTLPFFMVGKEERHGLSELQNLNLQGELKIEQICNVRNPGYAKEAKLINKHGLRKLELSWHQNGGHVEMKENTVEILDCLQPHGNLKELHVTNYWGISFPGWMWDPLLLPNLVSIHLENCHNCDNLPPFGQLPFLKELIIDGMSAVKHINNEFYGNSTSRGFSFPCLMTLQLERMSSLETWATVEGRQIFPCLDKLTISKCPKLMTALPCFPSLTTLNIEGLHQLLSLPEGFLRNMTTLKTLNIVKCYKLKSLPAEIENILTLKSLFIHYAENLVSLSEGLRNLTSLQQLDIIGCYSLTSLPEEGVLQGLISLQHLSIQMCQNLTSLPDGLKRLTALGYLKIGGCSKLASLPNGLQHVTTLQHLIIEECPSMVDLPEWIGNLTSLQSLSILGCYNMASLPTGLRQLTSLQSLDIERCPMLVIRCDRESAGEDWDKIAHIPNIKIVPLQKKGSTEVAKTPSKTSTTVSTSYGDSLRGFLDSSGPSVDSSLTVSHCGKIQCSGDLPTRFLLSPNPSRRDKLSSSSNFAVS